ncbi:type IV pilus secretin PilQ [Enterobacteriaceae bacterium YMB-R22]|jgi:protein transport protein HofQ|uniref:type IV pilus secretin PilQ n=1 Tax=Tenebrionicola larvae TaxID=2815733 RepID=UPI0020112D81|nr:type IV pilus secretin PilQ [Tenebrionicola larvae]MBV4413189.1 type IV pilus secretin PilQ [Tenebrionicola larvae]
MTGRRGIITLLLCPALAAAQAQSAVSLLMDDVPVAQILQTLAESQRFSLVIAPGVEGRLSLNFNAVPWQQAFEAVAGAAGLGWEKRGDVLSVWPGGRRSVPQPTTGEVKSKRLPTQREIFPLSHADAAELAIAMKAVGDRLLSRHGSVTVDRRTNRLLIDDTRAALRGIRTWIEEMDRPVEQVELAAHIVTMTQQSLHELGVRWFRHTKSAPGGTPEGHVFGTNLTVAQPAGFISFNIGRINGRQLELELSALERKQQLAFIASPRLLAAHRQTASIKQGTEIPYVTASTANASGNVQFRDAVLGMEVMPTVLPQQRVRLKLRISQNAPGQKLQQAEGEVLLIDKQEIETQIEIKEGETVALGGIFQQRGRFGKDNVPGLGNVPLLGTLFRHSASERERRELVVFITPRLVKASGL